MILFSICTSSTGLRTLLIIKILLQIVCTIIPLVIIYRAFSTSMKNTINGGKEVKKDLSTLFKNFVAGLIIFLIPTVINYTFTALLDTKSDFVACINNASLEGVLAAEAKEEQEAADKKKAEEAEAQKINKEMQNKRKKEIEEAAEKRKEQEKKREKLDFSCTSDVVKAQFSCSTLKIVEKHLYDLNAQNFYDVINSYGGFENYAKSVGGIFGEYYGKTIEGRTEKDFQTAAEYVLGWMFMYGWDYASAHEDASGTSGEHAPWGLTKYTPDAFYVNGGYKRKFKPDYPGNYLKQPDNTDFDHIISGMNGVDGMASECGDIVGFTYKKLGLKTKKRIAIITRLRDLKVGDSVGYSNDNGGGHMNMVGEVYDDHIVFYDAGRYMQGHLDYKRPVYFPKEDSKAADDAVILKEYGMTFWEGSRWYNFES